MAKKKKTSIVSIFLFLIAGVLLGVCLGFYGGFFFLSSEISFTLQGEALIEINQGDNFVDPGVKAIIYGEDVTKNVVVEGDVVSTTPGIYIITYKLDYKPISSNLTRAVVVNSSEKELPEFYLLGKSVSNINIGSEYTEEGTSMSDVDISFYDENDLLVDRIDINSVGTYTVKYTYSDGSDYYTLERIVNIVDEDDPIVEADPVYVFALRGNATVHLIYGDTYTESGFIARVDGEDISSYVQVTLNGTTEFDINTLTPGYYTITYHLSHNSYVKEIKRLVAISLTQNTNLSIQFLELGNSASGDSIYIKAGDNDILVDAGSKRSSGEYLSNYLDEYVEDNTFEYVFVTHAHEDHIAGFVGDNGIFARFKTENIIDFNRTNNSDVTQSGNQSLVGSYREAVSLEVADDTCPANYRHALEVYQNENNGLIDLGDGITIQILYNYYYENRSSSENNYSVCFLLSANGYNFLFTGDLEEDGEERLVANNELPHVNVFKAGHHGSNTSNSKVLLDAITPDNVIVCAVVGSVEYTQTIRNTFPYEDVLIRLKDYTNNIYATTRGYIEYNESTGKYVNKSYESLNGVITVSISNGGLSITGSNNNTVLKDTDWYKERADLIRSIDSTALLAW